MYLLDTDILIDYLRLYEPAVVFLNDLSKNNRAVALLTQFELLKGCHRKEQEMRVNRFLKHFKICALTQEVSKVALQIYRDKRWATGIQIPDSFIAATAVLGKRTIVTRNAKHYQSIYGLRCETPYH